MFRFGISVCICYTENQLLKKKRTNNEMTILHNILARDIFSSLLDTRKSYSTYLQKIMNVKKYERRPSDRCIVFTPTNNVIVRLLLIWNRFQFSLHCAHYI